MCILGQRSLHIQGPASVGLVSASSPGRDNEALEVLLALHCCDKSEGRRGPGHGKGTDANETGNMMSLKYIK